MAEPLAGCGGGDVREPGGVAVHVPERHRRDGVRRPAGATAPGGQERYVRPSSISTEITCGRSFERDCVW